MRRHSEQLLVSNGYQIWMRFPILLGNIISLLLVCWFIFLFLFGTFIKIGGVMVHKHSMEFTHRLLFGASPSVHSIPNNPSLSLIDATILTIVNFLPHNSCCCHLLLHWYIHRPLDACGMHPIFYRNIGLL